MRIVSGKFKGSKLHIPKNKNTRPLKDIVRESIFNLIAHSNKISLQFEGSYILDLYAGTGSFGLECLSRGAKSVYFVEKEKDAIDILKKNIEKLNLNKKVNILKNDIYTLLKKKKINLKFNLIFCDPPFKDKNVTKLIDRIYNSNILKKYGIFILHRNKNTKEKFPNFFKIMEEKKYGISKIIFGSFLF